MKKIAILWLVVFLLSAISIAYTFKWVISPIWVTNVIIGFYLIRFRHVINSQLFNFSYAFTAIMAASILCDSVKTIDTKLLLVLICAVQVNIFIYLYYEIMVNCNFFKYKQTIAIAIPNIISAAVGGLLFMMIFNFGVNSYEFFDYFLEQFVTGLSVMSILYGASHWKKIDFIDYIYILLALVLQYWISVDPIFYACFIFPFLMCYFALKYKLKEFSFLIGLLTFICSVYVSIPLAGEFWSTTETLPLSRISSYRLALGSYLIVFFFVCEIYLNNKRLSFGYQRLIFRDELTGLKNRYYISEKILNDLDFKNGYLLLIDIDDFKNVNDIYGHNVGDLVIKHITHILNLQLLPQKVTVRWGGEEFLVIVPHADSTQCRMSCEQILMYCKQNPFIYENIQIDVTVSVGAILFDSFTVSNYVHWVQEADRHLYEAKAMGKKQYVLRAI